MLHLAGYALNEGVPQSCPTQGEGQQEHREQWWSVMPRTVKRQKWVMLPLAGHAQNEGLQRPCATQDEKRQEHRDQ